MKLPAQHKNDALTNHTLKTGQESTIYANSLINKRQQCVECGHTVNGCLDHLTKLQHQVDALIHQLTTQNRWWLNNAHQKQHHQNALV